MKRLTLGAWIVCGLMMAAQASAQQKLGDVAGSIKLKKTGDETVVIDGSSAGQSSRRSTSASGSDLLYDVMSDCLEASRALSTLLADAPRITPVSYSEAWRNQFDDIGQRLDEVSRELQMLPDAGRYEDAYQKSVAGLDEVRQGFAATATAVVSGRLVISAIKRQVSGGADAIEGALAEVRAVGRSEAKAAPAPPIDPIAASASIRRICTASGAEGTPAFEACVDEQEAAMSALVGRTAPAVGLDADAFNEVRNGCLYEWPENYVNRDACERRRAAAARPY